VPNRIHLPLAAAPSTRNGADARGEDFVPSEFTGSLLDARGRPLRDLRISITDRCNFRCGYCMPKAAFDAGFKFLPRSQLLSFEEITRLARVFVRLGVTKLRLTGGEPLLRAKLPDLVSMLAELRVDIALTTNGSLLAQHARALEAAGLQRVTVSLDSLDEATFRQMNDVNFPVARVLEGIDAALAAGLSVKINSVVQRGVNDHDVLTLADAFKARGVTLRFIEYMDVGTTNSWDLSKVIPGHDIIAEIAKHHPLEPVEDPVRGEVATRFRYLDGGGEVGVITSVTRPFCGECTRARLSSEGRLFTCLFGREGADLREPLRSLANDSELEARVAQIWARRDDHYSELRGTASASAAKVEMSYIGG
jgi:cyclic pyranopterin phosphate synthase